MISIASLISMAILGVCSLTIPVVFFFILRRYEKVSVRPIIVGAAIFLVFSQVLEKGVLAYVLEINQATKEWMNNAWLFAGYGALMAGLFEEVGRFLGFKLLLRNHREWKDGLAYGLGHGGFEAILIGTMTVVQYLLFSLWINAGTFDRNVGAKVPETIATLLKHLLINTPWYMYDFGILERAMAFLIQLAISLFILSGIRNKKRGVLWLAIVLHALVDFPIALYQKQIIPLILVEGLLAIFGGLAVWYIIKTKDWKRVIPELSNTKIV
jgi:uncharacterized membrane protein YhfC